MLELNNALRNKQHVLIGSEAFIVMTQVHNIMVPKMSVNNSTNIISLLRGQRFTAISGNDQFEMGFLHPVGRYLLSCQGFASIQEIHHS